MHAFYAVMWCGLFVVLFVLLGQVCLYIYDRWLSKKFGGSNNEFTGIFFGALSLIYSLIIAFVIVAVWEDYEELNKTIEQETDKLTSIVIHTNTLPDSLRTPIRSAIGLYCDEVLNQWEMPDASKVYQASAMPTLRLLLMQTEPKGTLQQSLFSIIDKDFASISELRRERLGHIRSHVPTLVWLIVLVGSSMLVIFSFLIETRSVRLKRTGVAFLTAMIAMSIFLVYTLDHPFNSSAHVDNTPYKAIKKIL